MRRWVLALNGSDKGVLTTTFDPDMSHRPAGMTPMAAAWINQPLHFSNWSGKDVRQMPTITMRSWATQTRHKRGRSSGGADCDAGIVIKTKLPRFSPEQMDVLSEAALEPSKEDLVYATWMKRAAAAADLALCCHVPRAPSPLVH